MNDLKSIINTVKFLKKKKAKFALLHCKSEYPADIKNLKPVEPYKGKGIKERGQFVLRKEGKKK